MSDTSQNLNKEISNYYKVFGSLAVLTVVTVAISNLKVGIALGVILGLAVATLKASLVASVFMHLNHEKKLIYVVCGFTLFFFISMILLIVAGNYSVPQGTRNLNFDFQNESTMGGHHGHDDHDGHSHSDDHKASAGGHH